MWLVDLYDNFECDWLIELPNNRLSDNRQLSNNKLSDNNLTSKLMENMRFSLTNHNNEKIVINNRSRTTLMLL